ncbi:uncharacterized protein LOC108219144 [Daucus carota subsp. sativus]|uniref:uncharacterized protein LOC108219144 n=1 Tax=Daucus carota subsp. sativus TaxID=79200 RepID=UPI0007EFC799|nr:PREDICTED: U3 small nucleolar RNA-associated protein 14 homolog A [Daucus carota subsp. sativus]
MVDTKRKSRDTNNAKMAKKNKTPTSSNKKGVRRGGEKRKRSGPHLPNAMKREIELLNPRSGSDDEIDSDEEFAGKDVYEYEEEVPEEESKKNRRYDPVENFEFELPEDFKDENVDSDEFDSDDFDDEAQNLGDDVEEDDDGRHGRMLQEITGIPSDAFGGKKLKNNIVISEAYPENEYNPSGDVLDGNGRISIQDLLDPLREKSGFGKLKKSVDRIETKQMSVHAPLRKPDREKLERKFAYEQSKKDITKWEPLVKRNREAPTIFFDDKTDLNFSTVGAIASEFEPRTEFEKQMAALVNNSEVAEAHKKDGARLLELNKVTMEDVKDHQDRLAKMRNLLFRHEMKAKRIKKIKSKTFHRLMKKDRLKAAAHEIETDPEAAKKLAMKQEYERIKERSTLKHKHHNKWAKRILERGLGVQDDGTRAAMAEQLHQNALLTRKMNSMKDDSNSDDSSDSDDDDDVSGASDEEGKLKLLERAKQKTLTILEDDEVPNSGLHSLPFMARGLEKRKAAAEEEAKLALQEYEASLKQSEGTDDLEKGTSSGRRVFGAPEQQIQDSGEKIRSNNYYGNSDSEDDYETKKDVDVGHARKSYLRKHVTVDPSVLRDKSQIGHDDLFKSLNEIVEAPGTKTTYDVAIFASNSWQKKQNQPRNSEQMKGKTEVDANGNNSLEVMEPALDEQEEAENDDDSDTEGNIRMVDGILSAVDDSNYELPSQAELIRRAFAGDDVEEEFEKDKEAILNEENPEPEKPVLLPGWGQWTHVQKKRGLPSWMLAEHDNAKKKREEALKKRKDAHLKNVIISEKVDRKAEKLHTKTLPYPYTSKEVFEQSIRMPIGPEFNPASALEALNCPEVRKRSGVIIKPIGFEDMKSHERAVNLKQSGKKRNAKNQRNKS